MNTRIALLLALAVGLAGAAPTMATVSTPAPLDAATAAQLVAAVRSSGTDAASLQQLTQTINAHMSGLTPAQAALLAQAGPVAPNHAVLVDEISRIRADATLTPATMGYRIAETATLAQASALGVTLPVVTLAGHALPSDALQALAFGVGVTLTADEITQARTLDTLPTVEAAALARVIDAYAAMNDAATRAILADPTAPMWGETLAARLLLLDAIQDLKDAFPVGEPGMPHTVTGGYTLYNIGGAGDNFYDTNYALSIDMDGKDTYQNNAGGNWLGNCQIPTAASAFIDLGGDDIYAPAYDHHPDPNITVIYPDACGKSGGAKGGVGFLLDQGGSNDYGAGQYDAVNGGANGAASLGSLFSLDGVNDEFRAGCTATNGGAANGGVGLLIATGSGSTWTDGGCDGSNGGASNGGMGMMIDMVGGTHYADWTGTNGGASGSGSVGFAYGGGAWNAGGNGVNGGGNSGYGTLVAAGSVSANGGEGANGGATNGGTGFLSDATSATASGDNGINGGGANSGRGTFITTSCWCTGGSYGVNGGAYNGGSGFLYTTYGSFHAGGHGVNGGAETNAVGHLIISGEGGTEYKATGGKGANGGATDLALGYLIDAGFLGAAYMAEGFGTNGGGTSDGVGFLLDGGGNDRYTAGIAGTNGGGNFGGSGTLVDLAGNDAYKGGSIGTNGGGNGGFGLLLDAGGSDTYTEQDYSCDNVSTPTCTNPFKDGGGFLLDIP